MASESEKTSGESASVGEVLHGPVTRRDFLKVGAVAGAALGVGGALGGSLAACGSSGGSSGGGSGREIKVGFVAPITGPLAAFGVPDQWCVDQWTAAVKDGIKCGDGQVHPVTIILRDSQSDTNRAATVAGDLITNDCPWQSYFYGRGGDPAKPFKWTYHSWWGLEGLTAVFIDMWSQLSNNKTVGEMWPNDGDGLAWADPEKGQPPFFTKAGFKIVDGGRYQDGSEDFTPQISKFRSANCDIVSGSMIPSDFTNFWKQCTQQGFHPPIATVGKALLFPTSLEALGPIGYYLSSECWWTPTHPFKSSLTDQTCREIADAYEKDTGKQWTQPILHYAIFEVVVDALKRTTNVDDKEAIITAVKNTDMQTIGGRVTWKAGPPLNPVPNVCTTPITGGQWVKGTKYPFDLVVVSNSVAPEVPTTAKLKPITY